MTRKPIEYDPHAIQQMRDRGITRVNVRWMLAHGASVDAGDMWIYSRGEHARQKRGK